MKIIHSKSGFTLVEMILYVGLFAIVLSLIVQLFWQVQLTEVKTRAMREVKESTSQIYEVMKDIVLEADSINKGGSVFGSSFGSLELVTAPIQKFDTYLKNITMGGNLVAIRKLRLTEGATIYDLTSDHVNVVNFLLTDLSAVSSPDSIQIDLQIDAVNPDGDPNFDASLSSRTSFNIRKEL